MKLNEFVDRLYAMGGIESPKTIKFNKSLNESYDVSDELFDEYKLDDFKDVGDIYNEITFNYGDEALADDVVSRIEVYRNNRDDDYYDEDDLDESYRNDDFRDLCREYSSLYPYDISIREVWDEIVRNYEDEDLANDVVDYLEGAFGDEEEYDDYGDDYYDEDDDLYEALEEGKSFVKRGRKPTDKLTYDEVEEAEKVLKDAGFKKFSIDGYGVDPGFNEDSKEIAKVLNAAGFACRLETKKEQEEAGRPRKFVFFKTRKRDVNEAANPENDEVNAVLRKWANSNRNRISKRDQKVLDDAGVSLETAKYDAPHKYAVHKNHKDDRVPHAFYKDDIKRAHPDHDLANDLATTGRHWSNRDRYNKNKDPRFPWRDAEYRSETPEESDALRPYSDKYKSLKRAVDDSEGYPYWHAGAEQDLDDFRASIPKRKKK